MFPADAKILIIDDSTYARTMLKKSLTELKYWKILEAREALMAKQMMQEEEQQKDPVHLVVCDLHMPEVSGLELLRWLRSQPKYKGLPVIVITSSQENAEILEAGKLGGSHYIIKPFDTAMLKEKLTSTWQKHGQKYVENLKQWL